MPRGEFKRSIWNERVRLALDYFEHVKDLAIEELLIEDGMPPFTAPLPESEEYHQLVAAAMANDPRYVQSKRAKARLAELQLRYGPPPDYPIPIGQLIPNRPAAEAAAMTGDQTMLP